MQHEKAPPSQEISLFEDDVRAMRGEPLSDAGASDLLASLVDGRRVVISTTSLDARRVFMLRARESAARAALDARERRVAHLVGLGRANKQIAHELGASNSTVARAIDRCTRTLGLGCRVDLAILVAALDRVSSSAGRVAQAFVEREVASSEGPSMVVLSVSLGASPLWDRLSAAERAVTELALAGHPSAAIALLRGHRSQRTVANQLACVFRKAGVSGRTELASRLLAG